MSRVAFVEHCQKLNHVPKSPVLLGLNKHVLNAVLDKELIKVLCFVKHLFLCSISRASEIAFVMGSHSSLHEEPMSGYACEH